MRPVLGWGPLNLIKLKLLRQGPRFQLESQVGLPNRALIRMVRLTIFFYTTAQIHIPSLLFVFTHRIPRQSRGFTIAAPSKGADRNRSRSNHEKTDN